MADRPIIIKRYTGSTWDNVYPKTTIAQVINLSTELSNLQDAIDDRILITDAALKSHAHGNITNEGCIVTDIAKAAGDYLVISDASNSGKLGRAITLGSDDGTFLNRAGNWSFPSVGDDSITNLKLQNMPARTIKANTSATAGNPMDVDIPTFFDLVHANYDIKIVTAAEKTAWNAKAEGNHSHGNLDSSGTMGSSTIVAPANGDTIIIADTSNGNKIEKGIIVGTGTTTYLRNNGTWGTPPNTNYYLSGVSGSGNGTVTFGRTGLSSVTWDASHTHDDRYYTESEMDTFLSGKQATITGAVSNLVSSNLTAWKVCSTDGNGKIVADSVNQADLANISGSSGNFQTQINAKVNLSGGTMTGSLVAKSVSNAVEYTTAQMRNVIISTGTPTGGSSGDIWIKYV